MDKVLQVLCHISEQLDALLQKAGAGSSDEITSLILPITIGNNQPQQFVESNDRRVGLVVHNNSGSPLYLAISDDEVQVGPEYYSFVVAPDDHLILDQQTFWETYKGELWGVWEDGAPNDSKAMITELSKEETA